MKSLLLFQSVLALSAWVHTIPCGPNRCGGYSYMGPPTFGYANANVDSAYGGGYEVGEASSGGGGGDNGGGAGEYQGGGGSGYQGGGGSGYQGGGGSGYQGGGGSGYQGGGGSGYQGGGGSGYQGGGGGGYQGGGGGGNDGGYRPPRRNNYCPNCYVQNFGNGRHNANTINIKRRHN